MGGKNKKETHMHFTYYYCCIYRRVWHKSDGWSFSWASEAETAYFFVAQAESMASPFLFRKRSPKALAISGVMGKEPTSGTKQCNGCNMELLQQHHQA